MDIQGNSAYNSVVLIDKDGRVGDVLSVFLSEQPGSNNVWTLTVYAHIAQGWFQAGKAVVTVTPSAGNPPSRAVAFAFVPGADGWRVDATCPTTVPSFPDLILDSSKQGGGAVFGVSPVVY